jgi:hypothetical protein
MRDGIHSGFQPKHRSVYLCVLVAVTILGGIEGQALLAQERRSGPKVITIPDAQGPNASQTLGLTPLSTKKEARIPPVSRTLDCSSEVTFAPTDVQLRKAPASMSVGRSEPRSALTPPRFQAMRMAAVQVQPPALHEQQSVNSAGETVPSLIKPLRETSVMGRTDDAGADRDKSDSGTSAVSRAVFATTERSVAVAGESSASDAEPPVLPTLTDQIVEPNGPAWRIVGEWGAISFSIALSLLACSLVLLTMRRQISGKHSSILRVELAPAEGGNFFLPFSPAPQPDKAGGRGSPRGHTPIADFSETPLAASMPNPIFGDSHGRAQTRHGEHEMAILQQILEDNIALQNA